jgi:hypothetical protein
MHFILDGRVGVMITHDHGGTSRVRSLGRYTKIGEMGLVLKAPRSASIRAELDSILYCPQRAAIRGGQARETHARSETSHLFRGGHGRASFLRQPRDRGVAPRAAACKMRIKPWQKFAQSGRRA